MSEKPEDIGIDSKPPAERDRIDLNRELAGTSGSRIQRFFTDDSLDIYGESEKKKAERHYRSMLQILLAEDAQYLALYTQVSETLKNAYQAVDQALIYVNQRLQYSVENLEFLRENATELEDGTKVYRSENNSVFTENGKRLSDEITRDIMFLDSSTSWEEYSSEKEKYDGTLRQKIEVETYKHNVLDHAHNRLNNEDEPPSMDELDDLKNKIETTMPSVVSMTLYNNKLAANLINSSSTSVAHDMVNETSLNVPDLGASFDLASVDIPDLAPAPTADPSYSRTLG